MMKCCFDKRACIGLGVLAVALLVIDPHVGWLALPVLAGLACPVSMLFMMRGMRAGSEGSGAAPAPAAGDRAAEIDLLRQEIRQLRAEAGDIVPSPRAQARGPRGDAY